MASTTCALVMRHDAITREAMPALSEAEWCAICDVMNGCGVWLDSGAPDHAWAIWAEIADAEADGLGEKWGVDVRGLSAKLKAIPLAGRIAVWDVAARFWASARLNSAENRDLLMEAGARIG